MQVRLSDPRLVVDLLAFLERAEYRALQVGPAVVEIDPSHELDGGIAGALTDRTLRAWSLQHPGVVLDRL
jgi:hypothetical protein